MFVTLLLLFDSFYCLLPKNCRTSIYEMPSQGAPRSHSSPPRNLLEAPRSTQGAPREHPRALKEPTGPPRSTAELQKYRNLQESYRNLKESYRSPQESYRNLEESYGNLQESTETRQAQNLLCHKLSPLDLVCPRPCVDTICLPWTLSVPDPV